MHLRDYYCSLHPRYLQGKPSLVDLFYIKGRDSKGYGKKTTFVLKSKQIP